MQFKEFNHQMQDGWGLATDGKILFGSDGTSTLYQLDPQTLEGLPIYIFLGKLAAILDDSYSQDQFSQLLLCKKWFHFWAVKIFAAVTGKKIVKYENHEVHNLNELEYVDGEVWANIWQVIIHATDFHCHSTWNGN